MMTGSHLDILEVQVKLRKEIVEAQIKRLEGWVGGYPSFTTEGYMLSIKLDMLQTELEVLNSNIKMIESR